MAVRVYLAPRDFVTIEEAERWDVKFNVASQQDILHLYGANGKETARFTHWVGVENK